MRTVILGAGSLGSAIGGALSLAGNNVTLVARSRAHVEAVNRSGLKMIADGMERIARPAAVTETLGLPPAELLIVLVKSFATKSAIEGARSLIGERTAVLTLQNGLGNEELIAEMVGAEKVVSGKSYLGGVLLSPGVVKAGISAKETVIGELDGSVTERIRAIAELFNAAGMRTTVSENIRGLIWDKLLLNSATGAVSAISGLCYGELYKLPEMERSGCAAVREGIEAARKLGIKLSCEDPKKIWEKARRGLAYDFKTSMLQSVESGRPTEIDFINGALARAAEEAGLTAPVNRTLTACVKGIEAANKLKAEAANRAVELDHAALYVGDIDGCVEFFERTFKMSVVDDRRDDALRQAWLDGGIQLIEKPCCGGGKLAHIAVACADVKERLAAALACGAKPFPGKENWFTAPGEIVIELTEAN